MDQWEIVLLDSKKKAVTIGNLQAQGSMVIQGLPPSSLEWADPTQFSKEVNQAKQIVVIQLNMIRLVEPDVGSPQPKDLKELLYEFWGVFEEPLNRHPTIAMTTEFHWWMRVNASQLLPTVMLIPKKMKWSDKWEHVLSWC